MSKLYFRYGAMNCGKTTLLMAVAYNYEERGMKVKIIKSKIDTKGDRLIVSRIGISREVDHIVEVEENLKEYLEECYKENVACVLVDEAHFLNKEQVDELFLFTKKYDIPVICYGLRSDFKTEMFTGSLRLMEIADVIEELITICSCGKRAKFNARKENGEFTITGAQVEIDGDKPYISYEPLCGKCYLEKVLKLDINKPNSKKEEK